MSRTLDTILDAQHGTVDGYRQGCRGSHCPAGDEHGLSCSLANTYAAGNWNYMKALRRGLTPAEIAAELNLTPTGTKSAPVKPVRIAPDEDIELPEEEPIMNTTPTTDEKPKPSVGEIRAWAREQGIDVPDRGVLSRSVIDAFNARGKGIQASDVKPAPPAPPEAPRPEAEAEETPILEAVEPVTMPTDWTLPLTAHDLRVIANALEALEKVPLHIVDIESLPVIRPGGIDVVGDFRLANDDDEAWLGFVPRGAA